MAYSDDARAALNTWWDGFVTQYPVEHPGTNVLFGVANNVPPASNTADYLALADFEVEDGGAATVDGTVRQWNGQASFIIVAAPSLGLEKARRLHDDIKNSLLTVQLHGRKLVINRDFVVQPIHLTGPGAGLEFAHTWRMIA